MSSWRLRSPFLVCLVPVVACQAPPASVEAPEASEAALTFSVVGDAPVIEPDDFGADYLLPGAAVVHEEVYHLYPVAFVADGTQAPRVLHLTSNDGLTWTGDPSASMLDSFAIEMDDVGPVPSSALVAEDGTWLMYGSGRRPGGDEPIVWRATAPGPNGPWIAHPDPVLVPDADGWDSAITDHPAVLRTEDAYVMGYGGAAAAAPNRNRIGIATSSDGVTWTRQRSALAGADDGQALGPSACGVDARSMFEPHLLATDEGHRLVFGVMLAGERDAMEIISVTSPDAVRWRCRRGDDAVTSDDFPGAPILHSFVAFHDDDDLVMLVEVLGEAASTLWLVRSGS